MLLKTVVVPCLKTTAMDAALETLMVTGILHTPCVLAWVWAACCAWVSASSCDIVEVYVPAAIFTRIVREDYISAH